MSTKMSNDLNISRPTSRVLRAPGGGSSISFGDSERHVPQVSHSNGVKVEISTPAEPEVEVKVPLKQVKGKVGIVIAGKVATDFFRDAIAKALVLEGIMDSVVSVVEELSVLPYASQLMAKSCDVVISAAFMDADLNGAATNSLNSTLLQLGIVGKIPIVPALVNQSSLLEAKVILPILAESWAKSVRIILTLDEIEIAVTPAPVIVEKTVFTPTLLSTDSLLNILRESLNSHGACGIIGIGRKFRIADDNRSGTVDLAEFTKVVKEHAFDWSAVQIKAVFDHFDKDKSGSISFDEFIHGLRGDLNERRKQLVLMAFEILDFDKSGNIELIDIQAKYDASKHPDVISGKRTKDDILREFLDTFDVDQKDGKVTPSEFCQYYGNVSSSIDSDDYFELMIRNAWHISGGEGWCANSSCRRVLVTHKDERQTVEEIKNDLGMKSDDIAALTANLVAQGINDIESIELTGGAKSSVDSGSSVLIKSNGVAAGTKPLTGEQTTRPATAPSALNPRRQPGGASTFVLG